MVQIIEVPDPASSTGRPGSTRWPAIYVPHFCHITGITDRFARGKFTQQFLPMLDGAWSKLQEAGFGDNSAVAYTIIANTLMHTIGQRNLRSSKQPGQRHDLNKMLARFEP